MKNTFLYGAIIALVVIVGALGYTKYANQGASDTVVASEEITEAVGTDEEAAENPDATAIAADAAVDATTEAQEAQADAAAEAGNETATTEAATTAEEGTASESTDTAAAVTADETPAADAAPATSEDVAEEASATAEEESLLAAPAALQMNVAEMMVDRVLGDANAPVTIVEYASFTCNHCAAFHNTVLPTVKEQLIETGKAKLIMREFPLNQPALKASVLARCAPADKYYDLTEVFFRNQDRWIKSEDPVNALKQLGALTGMDDAQMDACLNNKELETAILSRMTEAQGKYKVDATPTFIFNEGAEKFSGAQSPERFQQVVDQLSR